jgi:predicted metal-dependent hydrolase
MSLLPSYTHIINPKLKHIYLSFDEGGSLVVKSPKVPFERIEKLLLNKASWINKARKKMEDKKGKALDFSISPTLYFLGKMYTLELVMHDKKRVRLAFDGKIFKIFYQNFDSALFQKHIDRFYKEEALKYISPYVEVWANTMNVKPNNLTFRKTKRQWGSCSHNNNLSFNSMMMKLPKDVIQYIIVHELAHITHKHHQESFWKRVEMYLPEYKTQVKELKNYTT